MRIAICDDEVIYLEYLQNAIKKFGDQKNEIIDIESYPSAEAMLFDCLDTIPFDLLILDIQMGKMNGMELAKKIRTIDSNVYIIFLTGVSDYVFDGYEVGALRYLMKPLKEEQLFEILEKVHTEISKGENEYLIVYYNRENVKINLKDILYLEAMGHYVVIHTKNKEYEIKSSFNELMKELDDNFIKVHRSYIVNIKHVERINKENCILSNQDTVNVSRRQYQQLNEAFIAFYKGLNE